MDEISLAILMWGYLEDAVLEVHVPPGEAFDRFINWTRRPPTSGS
jgi:hypothetical protein